MTLQEFDQQITVAEQMRREARLLQRQADKIEREAFAAADLVHIDREPGFPCWTVKGVPGYFNTPLDALKAKENPT